MICSGSFCANPENSNGLLLNKSRLGEDSLGIFGRLEAKLVGEVGEGDAAVGRVDLLESSGDDIRPNPAWRDIYRGILNRPTSQRRKKEVAADGLPSRSRHEQQQQQQKKQSGIRTQAPDISGWRVPPPPGPAQTES